MTTQALDVLPDRIQKKLQTLASEVDQIVAASSSLLTMQPPGRVALEFKASVPRDILTDYERAQSVSFVARFNELPADYPVEIVQHEGKFYVGNLLVLRHTLNDFRALLVNQKDSIHYQKVHNVWYGMLVRSDPTKGLTIRAIAEDNRDLTLEFASWLGQHNQAIKRVLSSLELDYLYNGVLQHSDQRFSARFLQDYTSGEINYLLWKHARILGFVRELLRPYYRVMSHLTFPSLGAL